MPDFSIRLTVDNTQAKQEMKEVGQEVHKIELEASALAKAIDASMKAAAGSIVQSVEKVENQIESYVKSLKKADAAQKESGSIAEDFGIKSGLAFSMMNRAIDTSIASVKALSEAYRDAAAAQQRLANESRSEDDKIRELAGNIGKPIDQKFLNQFGDFRVATGMRGDEARQFQTAFFGSAAQFVGQTLDEDQAQQLMTKMGHVATVKGMAPNLVGDMTGLLAGGTNIKGQGAAGVDKIVEQAGNALLRLQAGRGDNASLIGAFSKLYGTYVSNDKDYAMLSGAEDVADLTTLIAQTRPDEAEVYGRNLLAALSDYDNELIKKAGITAADAKDWKGAVAKIGVAIKDELKTAPEGTTAQQVVKKYYQDERTSGAITMATNNIGRLKDRDRIVAEQGGLKNLNAAIGEADRLPFMRSRRSEATAEQARLEQGRVNELAVSATEMGEAAARRDGDIDTGDANWRNKKMDWSLNLIPRMFMGGDNYAEVRKRQAFANAAAGLAQEKGVKLEGITDSPDAMPKLTAEAGYYETFQKQVGDWDKRMRAAGVENPMEEVRKVLERNAKANEKAAERLGQGRPVMNPVRPGQAGAAVRAR